ncbi:MAG: hypothetical protein HOV79_06735 [Hamadaea sp.]|nr:hypothetical protein [Hamadaea sp.]
MFDTYLLPADAPGDDVVPEGIAEDRDGLTFYVSSARHGTVYRGRTDRPQAEIWQPAGADGRTKALGMTVDPRGRLLVCGWETGHLFAYDTATGALAARVTVPAAVTGLNDVCVLDGYAYVTDSHRPVLWRVPVAGEEIGPAAEWLDLSAYGVPPAGESFLNGIVAGREGGVLLVSDQGGEALWRVDVATATAQRVDLAGEKLAGDGLCWAEGLLYACDNDEVDGDVRMWLTAVRMADDGRSGVIVGRWQRTVADTPTTLAYLGGRLLLVNSQLFAGRKGTAAPPYTVSAVALPTA